MRVALVSDCYLPRVGGIENQVADLAHQLRRSGAQVEVLTLAPGADGLAGGAVEVEDRGHGPVVVRRLGQPLPGGLLADPTTRPTLRSLLVPDRVDLVHAQFGLVSPFAADAVRAALHSQVPVVGTWHCHLQPLTSLWRASGVVRGWAARGLDLTAVSTVAAREVARAAGAASVAGTVTVLPNGIDTTLFRPRSGSAPSRTGFRIATAMRLAPRKRPDALLDVVAAVHRRLRGRRAVHLTVLGDGSLRPLLERRARLLGIGDLVTFAGKVPREQVADTVAAADVFLSTGRLEAFGVAALEARALGVPVVALAGSGVRDIVTDDVDGLLADDDGGLVEALCRLADDPALLGRLTDRARSTPPGQAWPVVTESVLAHYAAVLGRGRDRILR